MDTRIAALGTDQANVILRPQLLAAGYSDDDIAQLRRNGELATVRRGAYMDAGLWEALDPVAQHRAATIAVVKQLKTPVVPSHVTAAVLQGIPLWGVDLSVIHVTRTDLHASRIEAGVMHHAASLPEDDLCVVDGITTTAPARTAVDVARTQPFEQGVVVADAALARINGDRDALLHTFERMRTWSGARNAGRVVEFADAASESVGESRARVQFERIGLPRPVLQPVIHGPDGETLRPDFLFEEEQTLGEFDGRSKYGRILSPGQDPADVVWQEKRREDTLRAMGFEVVRSIWPELTMDRMVRARYQAAFERARRRRAVII